MAKPGFYNENVNRAYPFLKGSTGQRNAPSDTVEHLGFAAVADAGFVMGLQAGFVTGTHSVWLERVERSGSVLTFVFATDAPGCFGHTLQFTRAISDEAYAVEHADDTTAAFNSDASATSLSISDVCEPEPLWSGFLVTGELSAVTALLPTDGILTRTDGAVVEPSLLQNLALTYVESVNLANQDRTRVDAAPDCPEIEYPFPVGPDQLYVDARCLRGHIRFKAGFNSAVRQETTTNVITLGAAVGAGEGEPCDEVPLFPEETPPINSDLLEGGPTCNQVVRSINGIGGQFAFLRGGQGVRITPDPDNHKIIVTADMNQMAVCFSDISAVSEQLPNDVAFTLADNGEMRIFYGDSIVWTGIPEPKVHGPEASTPSRVVDGDTITWTYTWGVVVLDIAAVDNRLNFTISCTNNAAVVTGFGFSLPVIDFPEPPSNASGLGAPIEAFGSAGPVIAPFLSSFNSVFVGDTPGLYYARWNHAASGVSLPARYSLTITNDNTDNNQGRPLYSGDVDIGDTVAYSASWRFGVTDAPDASAAYATANPSVVTWTEHAKPFLPVFLNDGPLPNLASLLAELADGNYQGVIFWDIEGYPTNFGHIITYIGDPRKLPTFNPTVDGLIDAYIASLVSDGYKVGFTIRPQELTFNGTYWTQEELDQAGATASMIAKVTYCQNRWGDQVSVFYVDSNNAHLPIIFRDTMAAFPDALLMPENTKLGGGAWGLGITTPVALGWLAVGWPYLQVRNSWEPIENDYWRVYYVGSLAIWADDYDWVVHADELPRLTAQKELGNGILGRPSDGVDAWNEAA